MILFPGSFVGFEVGTMPPSVACIAFLFGPPSPALLALVVYPSAPPFKAQHPPLYLSALCPLL